MPAALSSEAAKERGAAEALRNVPDLKGRKGKTKCAGWVLELLCCQPSN